MTDKTDIVERLRRIKYNAFKETMEEAADEIERLRAALRNVGYFYNSLERARSDVKPASSQS